MSVAKTLALVVIAALAEIGGAWLIWQGAREHRGIAWIGAGIAALAAYGFVATLGSGRDPSLHPPLTAARGSEMERASPGRFVPPIWTRSSMAVAHPPTTAGNFGLTSWRQGDPPGPSVAEPEHGPGENDQDGELDDGPDEDCEDDQWPAGEGDDGDADD